MQSKTITSVFLIALAALALPAPTRAATGESEPNSRWVGLWEAQLEGEPGVVLTLGDDDGRLGGAVAFNMVSREGGQAHIIGHDAHTLISPRIEGDTLNFQVLRRSDNRRLEMSLRMTGDGKAQFHCSNCGDRSPQVEILKLR